MKSQIQCLLYGRNRAPGMNPHSDQQRVTHFTDEENRGARSHSQGGEEPQCKPRTESASALSPEGPESCCFSEVPSPAEHRDLRLLVP